MRFSASQSKKAFAKIQTKLARGFSLISAIFLLVVLAGLGVAIVNISTVQHISSALDVQGSRAYLAARAGIEWGLYRQLRDGAPCSGSEDSFSLPAGTTLSGFTVTVTCILTLGATSALDQKQITAVACNQPTGGACIKNTGGGTMFVQRIVQVKF